MRQLLETSLPLFEPAACGRDRLVNFVNSGVNTEGSADAALVENDGSGFRDGDSASVEGVLLVDKLALMKLLKQIRVNRPGVSGHFTSFESESERHVIIEAVKQLSARVA
jgi:hypothetical protein